MPLLSCSAPGATLPRLQAGMLHSGYDSAKNRSSHVVQVSEAAMLAVHVLQPVVAANPTEHSHVPSSRAMPLPLEVP